MGLDWNGLKLLAEARSQGVKFDRSITLGRQGQYVSTAFAEKIFDGLKLPHAIPDNGDGYSEEIFRQLGARVVDSLDTSNYENATIVSDLNDPIPDHLHEQYDVVFDGGTLEHVFNFPQALRNAMSLPKAGGVLFIHTIMNNSSGHGFYQFSPELFYRTLNEENGYRIERMVAHYNYDQAPRFEIPDPEMLRRRIEVSGSWDEVFLFVQARRESIVPLFRKTPQQSDYSVLWESSGGGNRTLGGSDTLHAPAINQSGPFGVTSSIKRHLKKMFPFTVQISQGRKHRKNRKKQRLEAHGLRKV